MPLTSAGSCGSFWRVWGAFRAHTAEYTRFHCFVIASRAFPVLQVPGILNRCKVSAVHSSPLARRFTALSRLQENIKGLFKFFGISFQKISFFPVRCIYRALNQSPQVWSCKGIGGSVPLLFFMPGLHTVIAQISL